MMNKFIYLFFNQKKSFICLIFIVICFATGCYSPSKTGQFDTVKSLPRQKLIEGETIIVHPSVTAGTEYLAKEIEKQHSAEERPKIVKHVIEYFTTINGTRNLLCKRIEKSLGDKLNCLGTISPDDYIKLKQLWQHQNNPDFDSQYALPGFLQEAHYLITGYLDIHTSDKVVKVYVSMIDARTGEKLYTVHCWLDLNNRDILEAWNQNLKNQDILFSEKFFKHGKHNLLPGNSENNMATYYFENKIPSELFKAKTIRMNGHIVRESEMKKGENYITFLGVSDGVRKGLNFISALKKKFMFWQEENKLKSFKNPYQNSYAVIIAIDDYERKNDPEKRGNTGFDELDFMITHGNEIKNILQKLNFPEENIITLFNHEATTVAIEKTLRSFWMGGKRDFAGRLFIYFGGHGKKFKNSGYLITYDFDPDKPTMTGFRMKDLTEDHFENIMAKHILLAIDSCLSGLTTLGEDNLAGNRLTEFKRLSIIRNDAEQTTRNVLLAGTGEQKALWINGGIFTKALIGGLRGNDDFNNDNIIQFIELSNYVKNEVAFVADKNSTRQRANAYALDSYGYGRFMFFLQP